MSVYGRLDAVVADYRHQADDTAVADRVAAYATFLQSWNTSMNGSLFQSPSHALGQLQALVDLGYDWPRLHWALADVNARLGDMSAARREMFSAVEAAPYDEFILATAACTCFGLSLEEAVALNERYVARYPTAFYGWRNLARDYLNQGDQDATLKAAQQALALRPLDAEMRRYQAGALAMLEQPEPNQTSVDYYQSLVLDSLQLELQMAQVRNNVRRQAEARLTASELITFDRALVDHLNGTNLIPKLNQQFGGSISPLLLLIFSLNWGISVQAESTSPEVIEDFLSQSQSDQLHALTANVRAGAWIRATELLSPCLEASIALELEQRCFLLHTDLLMMDVEFQQAIKDWVDAEPENYHARLLKASMLEYLAVEELSFDYPANVPFYHRHRAQKFRLQSRFELESALDLNVNLPYAYQGMIRNLRQTGSITELAQFITNTLQHVPWSYEVAKTVLSVSMPRGDSDYTLNVDNVWSFYHEQAERFPQLERIADYQTLLEAQKYQYGYGVEVDIEQARVLLQELEEAGYSDRSLFTALTRLYEKLDQPEQARLAIENSLAIAPDSLMQLKELVCACNGFSLTESIAAADRYTRRNPISFIGWTTLGKLHANNRQPVQALNAFQNALDLRPYDPMSNFFVQWTQDGLGIAYEDFWTRQYSIELTLYSIPSGMFADSLAEIARAQLQTAGISEITVTTEQFFTAEKLTNRVRQQLMALDWDEKTWADVSASFADRSKMGEYLQENYRRQLRQRFSALDGDHEVGQVMDIYADVRRSLLEEYIALFYTGA